MTCFERFIKFHIEIKIPKYICEPKYNINYLLVDREALGVPYLNLNDLDLLCGKCNLQSIIHDWIFCNSA